MRSPGHPPFPREVEGLFRVELVKGPIPAAAAVRASQPVGPRRFHNAGGVPPFSLEPLSGRYLSFHQPLVLVNRISRGRRSRSQHATSNDLDWKIPAMALDEHLQSIQQTGVASNG